MPPSWRLPKPLSHGKSFRVFLKILDVFIDGASVANNYRLMARDGNPGEAKLVSCGATVRNRYRNARAILDFAQARKPAALEIGDDGVRRWQRESMPPKSAKTRAIGRRSGSDRMAVEAKQAALGFDRAPHGARTSPGQGAKVSDRRTAINFQDAQATLAS